MKRPGQQDQEIARQGRMVAMVIVLAALLHLAGPWLVAALGLAPHYANLISLFAIAAFVWSFAVAWRIWRRRREE